MYNQIFIYSDRSMRIRGSAYMYELVYLYLLDVVDIGSVSHVIIVLDHIWLLEIGWRRLWDLWVSFGDLLAKRLLGCGWQLG